MTNTSVTSVIETFQRRLHKKPYVPCTTFRHATQISCSSHSCSAIPMSASTSWTMWG